MRIGFILCIISSVFCIKQITTPIFCKNVFDCSINGQCVPFNNETSICKCNTNYISVTVADYLLDNTLTPCNYKQKTKLELFLESFFVGIFGVDWFVLANGNGVYIFAGVCKIFTLGFLGIWWLADWIRILAGTFPDGNGMPLADW